MIIIHAVSHVQEAKVQAYLEDIQSLISSSREESGNVSYDLYRDTENENKFVMVEVWKDAQAVENHNSSNHFTSFVAKAKDYLAAPLEVKLYNAQTIERG